MRQAYNTPNITFVRLPKRDIITNSDPQTLSVDFNTSIDNASLIGAPDRIRDWE